MNKILIVTETESIGEGFQQLLSQSGFFTAYVKTNPKMVEFCQQHTPDLVLIDVDGTSEEVWSSVHAVRTIRDLSNLPFLGVSNVGDEPTLTKAKEFGFSGLMPIKTDPETIVNSIQVIMTEAQHNQQTAAPSGLQRLKELSQEVENVTGALSNSIAEFGSEGHELFDYIRSSSTDIETKLSSISEADLSDKELRHDFRNMIGSVTGFSELILMEPSLSPMSQKGFTRLRECSKEFVELLDQQKAGAS